MKLIFKKKVFGKCVKKFLDNRFYSYVLSTLNENIMAQRFFNM